MDFLAVARRRLSKPAYVYRPGRALSRLTLRESDKPRTVVRLPWGLELEVNPRDHIGGAIHRSGVHELPVTETAWRLTRRCDLALDVGANIGYFTSMFALRAERVEAVEPHPALRRCLIANTRRWPGLAGRVAIHAAAASDAAGIAQLKVPTDFATMQGTATLAEGGEAADLVDVSTVTLDSIIGVRRIGVLKIDIERHEVAAFAGARGALAAGRIRDVLFEEHDRFPTPVTTLLEDAGYHIYGLHETLRGVRLVPPEDRASAPKWDAPTYLATRDPERAATLMQPRGWHCLRPR